MRHQRATNQETIGKFSQITHLLMGINTGFGNNDGALWNERRQLLGAI
ncbi:Uncharacterised protein [Vibrio cholerae]|uniref:Uncharacterized protein n=1 Tax=Vibrio cholerae TaxID=666 RepID=A0A655PHJ1_VIBCL|nr:Uncharacterised protein [Vibrio cholerae]CSB60058.1 Uncharacterised protein [Vibrio cholerae]CSH90520.1 Uncharacterised protein [Vibrio cholerae]